MMSLKTATRIATTFFIIGTVLAIFQFFLGELSPLLFIGLVYIVVAVVTNSVIFLILLINLIKHDRLETFYAMCVILLNLPIAVGYAYILMEYSI